MEPYDPDLFWLVICGFVIAFILAFGIGANDVANSFGTSVGSKVLTLTQACILATIFEIAGAVLIGYKVSDTMRKGILDVSLYTDGGERLLAAGCLAALLASAAWLLLATALRLPVSGTHSVVGATVGFTLTAKGPVGIRWSTLGAIVLSWFISPALSGAVSAMMFWLVRRFILRAPEPLVAGLRALPFFYGATVAVNVVSVVHDGPKLLAMDKIPTWIALSGSMVLGVLVAALVRIFLVPYYRRCLSAPPVNFTLGLSNETTPANTPTHFDKSGVAQRPTSLLSDDGKLLEAIEESAEMVTLSDADKGSMDVREMNARNRALLATMDDCSILSRSLSPPNQSRLQLVDADPQINTLKYIDETLSCCKSLDSSQLAGMGESYGSGSRNGFLGDSCDTIARGEGTRANGSPPPPPPRLDKGPEGSAWSIERDGRELREGRTALPALTPNSSAAPLLRAGSPRRAPPPPPPDTLRLFSFLQVLTATFGAFAHGGNDVSNAIGPLVALWLLYSEGGAHARAETPLAILVFGGVGIAVGLWLWGRRVIQTVGEDLTSITADTGFTIELGAALTVLVASKAGLPVSTTHCKVGSVVCVGYFSEKAVDWSLFRNIIFAWLVTVPAVAAMASLAMLALEKFVV
ncbi:PREDICTED: sodium-dependent phosphate transporter 1 [Papilio xuthus]|uniref:Phosphate transporter n=1 Tax=Papilio xuthus TaxID=66420 RepID=A0A194PJU0_PAPXU|nr:PREDICTED: sodium-dependent phosphate transporter 1 [Papilio xuthus]XP_013167103.1 PREDICTED: sodium-dependent phosphate transporter 1 [Papilio xuthus]XP_013167104.1 PREDICTED: sodium-dependent phosphate transporter 1 [Papilio xuthus]XP_013167105.1 PREDICTED: sodium-dependent phosphate transporter 1 [Papilio xuthus]KPI93293.1 Sodium-dependent phosphate transporter 1 [Papilio xuthus]